MSAQDLNIVHRRYVVVSSTFKSAWTFHQFVQSLRKVYPAIPTDDYPADLTEFWQEGIPWMTRSPNTVSV